MKCEMKKKVMSNLLGLVGARKKVRCEMKRMVMTNLIGLVEARKKVRGDTKREVASTETNSKTEKD